MSRTGSEVNSRNTQRWLVSFAKLMGTLEDEQRQSGCGALPWNGSRFQFSAYELHASFTCHNCRKEWGSNLVTVGFSYRIAQGVVEIRIEKEYKQDCRRCEHSVLPVFAQRGTDKAMQKLADCLRNRYYLPPKLPQRRCDDESEETHEVYGPPHDTKRCEACRTGRCSYTMGPRTPTVLSHRLRHPRETIFEYAHLEVVLILQGRRYTVAEVLHQTELEGGWSAEDDDELYGSAFDEFW
eukprot:Sspe_Gene.81013::Locus_51534_Transcript_1_1_Confidence_1.000_Length_935::g.81013::m.81013